MKHINTIINGLKIFAKFPKPLLLSRALSASAQAVIPFINIWFAAQILNELAGARSQSRLVLLALLTIGLNLVGFFGGQALRRRANYCMTNSWYMMFYMYTDKMFSLDYIDLENPDIQRQNAEIRQHHNGMGFGLPRLLYRYDLIIGGIVRLMISVAFAFTLFTRRTPEGSPFAFLDSPAAVLFVLLMLACSALLAPLLQYVGEKAYIKLSDGNNAANRLFSFYFNIMYGNESSKDIRIYKQQRLIRQETKKSRGSEWRTVTKHAGRYIALATGVSRLANGLIYLFVALKAFAGAFGVGSIVQYVGAITQFGQGFQNIVSNFGELVVNNAYLEKVLKFLETPNKKYRGTLPVEKRDDNEYAIEFKNVSFKYPGSETYALRNLSLTLNIGRRLAVVGMNGSGKTTMIKLLCRLYDPTEGEITLNGIDIKKYNYDEYMAIFGIVFQDFTLLPFTLGQNVAASVEYDREKARETLAMSGFDERFESLPNGLDTYLYKHFEEDGVEVSGGEAQKIALARALYKDTPFIVLDEPTAALDPVAEYEIYTKFNEIVGKKTAIYISHRLSSCRFCDDIAVFHEGRIVQRGNHNQLLSNEKGKYRELWNAQAQYYVEAG